MVVTSKCFAFRAQITQARIWIEKGFELKTSTSLLYSPISLSAETWKIFRNMLCQFFLAWADILSEKKPIFGKHLFCKTRTDYASVNSSCAQRPPRADPRALAFFLPWMANSRGWRLLSCQMPRGGDEKRGEMPRPPSTLQHFSLIAWSNSAVLSILVCNFLFQLTSSFVIALWRLHAATTCTSL